MPSITLPSFLIQTLYERGCPSSFEHEGDTYTFLDEGVYPPSRWYTLHYGIIKQSSTDKLYRFYWEIGNTEMQDSNFPEDYYEDFAELPEVEAKTKTTTFYLEKE